MKQLRSVQRLTLTAAFSALAVLTSLGIGTAVHADVTINMPPPPPPVAVPAPDVSTATQAPQAASASAPTTQVVQQSDTGRIAIARYAQSRDTKRNRYDSTYHRNRYRDWDYTGNYFRSNWFWFGFTGFSHSHHNHHHHAPVCGNHGSSINISF